MAGSFDVLAGGGGGVDDLAASVVAVASHLEEVPNFVGLEMLVRLKCTRRKP